jgi:tyrosine decarboxylase
MGSIDANPAAFAAYGAAAGLDDGFQPLNADDVRSYLHKSVDFIYDYYNTVESLPVLPGVEPGYLRRLLQSAPPTSSAPFDIAMKEVREAVVPGMTHWASPNFFAFFPSTNSAAAIAGELIASAMNTVGFTWQANPAATEMEVLALDWWPRHRRRRHPRHHQRGHACYPRLGARRRPAPHRLRWRRWHHEAHRVRR